MATATTTPTERTPAAPATQSDARDFPGARIWGVLRLAMGWVFLWAFLDKLLALGFASGRNPETGVADRFGDAAWIHGGSPTDGFLKFGLATRLAAGAGIVWMVLFYTASALSPENNPFMDDHIIYAIVLAGIAVVGGGRYLGLGKQWERLSFVQKYPILR